MAFNGRELVREPALILDFLETLLVIFVAFGLPLTHDQQAYIVAALVAAVGLIKGVTVHPFPPAVVTDFGRAALVLAASFGLETLSADKIALLVTALGTLTTLIMRAQVTPSNDPKPI
jgi:hypothetical protein